MKRKQWIRITNTLARTCMLFASLALLAACGGGGGGSAYNPNPIGGDGPPNDPPINPPPPGTGDGSGSGGSGSGSGGSSGGSGGGSGGDTGGDSGGGTAVPPITVPADPGPLPSYSGHANVSAMSTTASGETFAIDTAGQVLRKTSSDTDFVQVATIPSGNVRGLATTAGNLMLIVVDGGGSDDTLASIDMTDWTVTPIGSITGHTGVESLAFDTNTNTLYAVDASTGQLLTLDVGTAAATVVGSLGGAFGDVRSLTMDPSTSALYGADAVQDTVAEIDKSTGAATHRQMLQTLGLEGFSYDPQTDMFFGSAPGSSTIHELDVKGIQINFVSILGLAMNETAGLLYGSDIATARLIEIDPTTKWKRVIGYTGVPMLESLAYDNASGTLYGVSSTAQSVYTISSTDGSLLNTQAISGQGGPWVNISGLAFGNGVLAALDTDTADMLQLDPLTGQAILLGTLTGFGSMQSLAWDADNGAWWSYDDTAQRDVAIASDGTGAAFGLTVGQGTVGAVAWTLAGPKLFGSGTSTNDLVTLLDNTPTVLSHDAINAMALDSDTGTMLGVDRTTDEVVLVDPVAQTSAVVTSLPGTDVEAMAFDMATRTWYLIDNITETLMVTVDGVSINTVGTPGSVGSAGIRAMAYDSTNGIMYGIDTDTDELLFINTSTGVATVINPGTTLGFGDVEAIAWDPILGRLIGIDRGTGIFVQIDTATGAATQLSPAAPALAGVASLAYDGIADEFVAIDLSSQRVVRLSTADGTVLP